MKRRVLTPYAEEQLGHYVYALRNPLNGQVFYVGKGVGSRVLSHANGVIDNDDPPETMKLQTIAAIHDAGLEVESFVVQHGLSDSDHAFATESALYGLLQLLNERKEHNLFTLTNLIQPPTFETHGLMSVDDVLAIYGEPVDGTLIPHNSILVKPKETWRRGMSREELWEVTRGWWRLNEQRLKSIRYVFSIPNFVIRAVWEVRPEDWRHQADGDRGWEDVQHARPTKAKQRPRLGFTSCVDVSESRFASVLNKSVESFFLDGQGKRANVTYLDDARVKALAHEPEQRKPMWNTQLR
jgi:hypothetical protein